MNPYLKIVGGIILVTMGVYWLVRKIQDADYRDTPISTPKIVFSAVLSIVLGLMLLWEVFSN
jgi:putative Mn2+ efflux pump MntP